jgi:hypothetical protein
MAIERTPDNLDQNKNSFLMYLDHITVVNALSNEDAGMLLKALYHYASGNGNPEQLPPVVNVVFLMMQAQLKLDLKKWREKCNKNRKNVNVRWNKKDTTVYERIRSDTKHTDNEYEYEKENDNVITNRNKFVLPTKEQVKEYAISRNRLDLLDKFFDYYSEGDWKDKDGKKVKNWKQKFIAWENRNQQQAQNKPKTRDEIELERINERYAIYEGK